MEILFVISYFLVIIGVFYFIFKVFISIFLKASQMSKHKNKDNSILNEDLNKGLTHLLKDLQLEDTNKNHQKSTSAQTSVTHIKNLEAEALERLKQKKRKNSINILIRI
ncbi:MAG: hypothetical protein KatS3mg035_1276 [Bacteroidia bacterium]|nr:MAG: hypothetical protein KatS3mg035_1276 [Bacteroidia bacterium]